ncbi:MAG: hypothetical protein KAI79_12105, partial [Bacteroidales bacterium]|nr:hypothetical protein [Bacteroidales bacterium]
MIHLLQQILNKEDSLKINPIVIEAMKTFIPINTQKRLDKIANPLDYIPEEQLQLNVNSSVQMRQLWKSLGLESDITTTAGEESFNKDVIKEIGKTTPNAETKDIINQVVAIANTKNLLSQYIPKYENSTVNGFVYQSIRFPGTLSYRVSGAMGKGTDEDSHKRGISMVTQPGTTKKAIEAKEGKILMVSDFAGLETNIAANITHDPTKI